MSQHYEMVFSLFLRADTPQEVLDELRYHLELPPEQPAERPDTLVLDYDWPVLAADSDSHLPGGDQAVLQQQVRFRRGGIDHRAWALHVRLYWLDDHWAELWWQVAEFLAPHVDGDGYIGFWREVDHELPTLLIVRDGKLYLCEVGGEPTPFTG